MADNPFIQIEAPHLCVMEGESDELCNDGVYGKALCEYLQSRLAAIGYEVPWIVCEDWGWFVPAETDGFRISICVYGFPQENEQLTDSAHTEHDRSAEDRSAESAGTPLSLCVTIGTQPRKYWDWRRFRRMDRSDAIHKLNLDLMSIFDSDSRITIVGCTDEFPFG